MTGTTSRRFIVSRTVDIHETSGTGIICDGVLWEDGSCTIRWRGQRPSIVHWRSIEDAEWVHSHGGDGNTTIHFVDGPIFPPYLVASRAAA